MTAHLIDMNFLDKILFYVSVPKCVFCGERLEIEESALCSKCKSIYFDSKERQCSVCLKPLYYCTCPNHYLESHFIHKHIKVFRYLPGEETPGNTLLYKLKRDNRRDVIKFLADELTKSISESVKIDENVIFTSVPRRRAAKVKYGFDHAKMLAIATAKNFGAEYRALLKSKAKTAQKKADSPEMRMENAVFKLKGKNTDLTNKTVIIIDDIVTTGASLGNAAFNIKTLLPKKIIGASVAIAYRDKYVPFSKEDRFNIK